MTSDRDLWLRRAADELARAREATRSEAAIAHARLAGLFFERARGEKAVPEKGPIPEQKPLPGA